MLFLFIVSKSCSNPKPVRYAIVDYNSVQEGSTVKYSCAARYGLVGDSKLTCRNGKWDGILPQCVGTYDSVQNYVITMMCEVLSL